MQIDRHTSSTQTSQISLQYWYSNQFAVTKIYMISLLLSQTYADRHTDNWHTFSRYLPYWKVNQKFKTFTAVNMINKMMMSDCDLREVFFNNTFNKIYFQFNYGKSVSFFCDIFYICIYLSNFQENTKNQNTSQC